jgi:hypothetical protein
MWNNIFREIIHQQVQIDLEERSNAFAAIENLCEFDRHAGPLYMEVSERYVTVPFEAWQKMGDAIDRRGIPLEENLEPEGKRILKRLRNHEVRIANWKEALACTTDRDILETKLINGGTLKYTGMLSRHAKRAFYRARDNYCAVLERVYERRVVPQLTR